MLTEQYRMHPAIRCFPSLEFYNASLLDGRSISLDHNFSNIYRDCRLGPMSFLNVPYGTKESGDGRGGDEESQSLCNKKEADVVMRVLRALRSALTGKNGMMADESRFEDHVGIVTPYNGQRKYVLDRVTLLKWRSNI